jgi:bifunctional oligoribonuclease and PAP phosphatase NrnA
MEPIQTIVAELSRAKRVLLLGHLDPDGDSAGSILALADALSDRAVYCYSDGPLPVRYRLLDPKGRLKQNVDANFHADLAIAMEAPQRDRLGRGTAMIEGVRLINMDHHRDNSRYGDVIWVDPEAAALGEMIYELLRAWGRPISPDMATCLYTAILTDTGRFRYKGTSARTLAICSELVELGADPSEITRQIYFGLPFSYLQLMRTALDGMEQAAGGHVLAFTLLPEHFEGAGAQPQDAEGIIDLTLLSDQVQIGMLFRQPSPEQVKISFRSQNGVDVGGLAALYGGGGHKNASGCTVRGRLAEVKPEVMKRAAEWLEQR